MKAEFELANSGLAGAQQGKQRGVLGLVVEFVGGKTQADRHSELILQTSFKRSQTLRNQLSICGLKHPQNISPIHAPQMTGGRVEQPYLHST
jgi:hypothetical protein